MTPLDDKVLVAGQISVDAIAALAAYGVTTIVNNRPDHEEPGQPLSAEIEAKVRRVLGIGTPELTVIEGGEPAAAKPARVAAK